MNDKTEFGMEMNSFHEQFIRPDTKHERNYRQETIQAIDTTIENHVPNTPTDKTVYENKDANTEVQPEEVIECNVVTNSDCANKYPQRVGNIFEIILLIYNWSKQLIYNIITNYLAGIVLISVLWWIMYSYFAFWIERPVILELRNLVCFIILYVICTVGGQMINLINNIPPFIGMLLASFALNTYLIEKKSVLRFNYFYEWGYFAFVVCEVTTFVIMIIGSLECHALKLRRIRGALIRLVLLPLTVEVFTFILVYTEAETKSFVDILDVKLIPYCGFYWTIMSPITLLNNLSQLQSKGYGEESDTITLLIAASNLTEIVICIADGLFIYVLSKQWDYGTYIN